MPTGIISMTYEEDAVTTLTCEDCHCNCDEATGCFTGGSGGGGDE